MSDHAQRTMWKGTDYLLRGEFCPPEAIATALDALRLEAGAEMALLLVAGSRGLLQTLCFAVSADERGAELTELLQREPGLRPRRLLRPFTNPASDTFPDSATTLLQRLHSMISDHGGDSDRLIGTPGEWSVLAIPEQLINTRLAVAAFLRRTEQDAAVQDGMGQATLVRHDEAVLEIAVMVNATAQARVHHDAIVMNRVDQALDASVVVGDQIDLGLAAESSSGSPVRSPAATSRPTTRRTSARARCGCAPSKRSAIRHHRCRRASTSMTSALRPFPPGGRVRSSSTPIRQTSTPPSTASAITG